MLNQKRSRAFSSRAIGLVFMVCWLPGCQDSQGPSVHAPTPADPGDASGDETDGGDELLPRIRINEFMANNQSTLMDEDGEPSDWIEIFNLESHPVSLGGWGLTDDPDAPRKWVFPEMTIGPWEYLVVFASDKNRASEDAVALHTNFRLDRQGEFLGLYRPGLNEPSSGLTPSYPEQTTDVSYGLTETEAWRYFDAPTPGAFNGDGGLPTPPVELYFSRPSGTFIEPFMLELLGESGDEIHYTLDGSLPNTQSPIYQAPISVTESTLVRVLRIRAETSVHVSSHYSRISQALSDFDSNLPLVIVDSFTRDPEEAWDEEGGFLPAAMLVFDVGVDGRTLLTDPPVVTSRAGIRLRGNSSQGYEKKQYAVEFWGEDDQDVSFSVLGMPSEGDWVLHAPFSDKTLMRNHLMYGWSRAIGRYAARTRFVEVFVDQDDDRLVTWDDYVGVYVLMEKIERDPERVPIEKLSVDHATEPEISGGYLLKKDWLEEDGSYFHTQHYDDALVFVDPGPQSITDSQRAWIAAYVDAFEGVLSGSGFSDPETGYAQYIDPDTFIDHHLLVEMGRNVDGFVLSTYLHKDRQGRLCMGPIWDYNGALGNADYFEAWFTAGWHTDNPEFPADNPTGYRWYERLFEDPVFVSAHAARWHELRAGPLGTQTLIADIDAAAALLTEAQLRNFERWDILGEYVWPNAEGWDQRQTHDAEVAYLKEWLTARLQWMDFALGQ